MTSNPDRYYRSAGAVPFTGILLMVGAGFIAAVVCGGLYAAADWYIAYDIVPFLCAPMAGAAIGAAVKGGGFAGRVRNRLFLALVGFAMGAVGAYFSWVFFIRVWDQAGFWLWDPIGLAFAIDAISEVGVWENQPVGLWLKVIYAIEALALIVPAGIVASLEMKPFCDPCNAWTEQQPGVAALKLTDVETLRERLEDSQYEALDELFDPQVDRANCLHAKVFKCPNCDDSNYLVVSHMVITEKNGETHQNETVMINNLWVPPEVVDQVQELSGGLREATATDDLSEAFGAKKSPDEPTETA